ncbi:hypothetical protein N7517_004383 [Penicillium concentricum]|uniref:Uncharacterized protein n=1 Tax=Penicillium concentricum TaxID=293559 RepID=A0A9W9S651_9EURO|nr:uncharacterized protein N7517_004383 [Penicillium concentricum]KAJ5372377.1 hypothetical protein N7517_004383 [Penicillium concentricum]
MWTSNIYVVQRHGNTFDTCRSLLGIHQITSHHRRIEYVASDIQKVGKLNRVRIPQPPEFQGTSLLTSQHAARLTPKFRNPTASLRVSLRSRLSLTLCILCLLPMLLGKAKQGIVPVQDAQHEREQIAPVSSSQSHYYRPPARTHQECAV